MFDFFIIGHIYYIDKKWRGFDMEKNIELYTWTYCPFCKKAVELLDSKGYKYVEHLIDNDQEKKQELTKQTGQSTVPYVFIDGDLIGGFDDLKKMDDEGKL